MTFIYVIDTETTGLNGALYGDSVIEVGLVRVDTDKGTVTPVIDCLVRQKIPEDKKDSWIFMNTPLTVEDVESAKYGVDSISGMLKEILTDEYVTSYNKEFDFDRFLNHAPYNISDYTKECECLMVACSKISEIPRTHAGSNRYPRMLSSYQYLCYDDPARLNGIQDHRGCSDSIAEGYILIELIKRGLYKI